MAILSKRILFCVTHFSNFNQKKLFVDSANLKKYINYSKKRQIVKENSNLADFVGFESESFEFVYDAKDVILYNLGVGASLSQSNGLDLLYEGSEKFGALTSFGVIPGFPCLSALITGQVPGLQIDLSRVLHGEQYTELLTDKFPTSGVLSSTFKIAAILNKGSGSLYILDVLSRDKSSGEPVVKNQVSIFVVGESYPNGPRTSNEAIETKKKPNRAPDHSTDFKTSFDQAALYRLSGDVNPLHIDPSFAQLGGFDTPILHGLCTEGIAIREITQKVADNDVSKIRKIKARFAKPVYPGQTVRTNMWIEADDMVLFECCVVETGKPCLTGGWVQLSPASGPKEIAEPEMKKLQSDAVFNQMSSHLAQNPQIDVRAIYRWIITSSSKEPLSQWVLDLTQRPGKIWKEKIASKEPKADCTLTLSDDDMAAMAVGNLKPQTAFMQGKLKVSGNIMLTQKLQSLIGNHQAKL